MRQRICSCIALVSLCAFVLRADGPEEYKLRSALVCPLPPGYAETVIAPNPIEAALADGSWKPPVHGMALAFPGGFATAWKNTSANEGGWFEGEMFNACYVHFTFKSSQRRLMILRAMGNENAVVNGVLRSGNPYGLKDTWDPWEPHFDYSLLPVVVVEGENEILMRCARGRLKVDLLPAPGPLFLNERDVTLPDLIRAAPVDTWGAIVVVNVTEQTVRDASITVQTGTGPAVNVPVPPLPPASVRKVGFPIRTDAVAQDSVLVQVSLARHGGRMDDRTLKLRVVGSLDNRRETFVSAIDGSVQYYGFLPANPASAGSKALLLSLHGAAVEAINQTASYAPKTWLHIAAPTNRRPYGFNWEDWGRLDAMEVLGVLKRRYAIDEDRVYLAGHSMGGHGTWHIGAMFPDQFAAIGPSAGWISFWTYRIKGQVDTSAVRSLIRRTTTPSETFSFVANYVPLGLYIIHGSADDNVFPDESRAMVDRLSKIHRDFVYHEEPGAGHWWDVSDEPGADCVDWAPMFDLFARHVRPGRLRVREVDFSTANPFVASRNEWVTVEAQERQLALSRVQIRVDPFKRRFIGSTQNIARMTLDTDMLRGDGPVLFQVDGQQFTASASMDGHLRLQRAGGHWSVATASTPGAKGPHRYGTFKEVFVRRVQLVYGTHGGPEENQWAFEKARYDAEKLWYQGNGAVDVVADSEYDARSEPERSVILYGNAGTNSAWLPLLAGSPVQVREHEVLLGTEVHRGDDLTCFLVRPKPGSDSALVGAVAGTGVAGMRGANRVPYVNPGINLPDCTIMSGEVLRRGEEGVCVTGMFGLDWSSASGEFAGRWQIR